MAPKEGSMAIAGGENEPQWQREVLGRTQHGPKLGLTSVITNDSMMHTYRPSGTFSRNISVRLVSRFWNVP